MIKESRPVTMAEVVELVGDSEKGEGIKKFIKGFDVLSFKKAEELNKIILEVSLDADEVNKILEVTKKYK